MRTLGSIFVSLYQFLRGIISLIFGAFILCYVGPANKLAFVSAGGNALERTVGGMGHAAGIVIVSFALIHFIAGYGIWRMKRWGRFLTILFSAIELVFMIPAAIQINTFSLIFTVLNAICILYLAMPPVRRSFRAGRLQAA
jgi:uncharacterized membrane protein (DUF2068 family)